MIVCLTMRLDENGRFRYVILTDVDDRVQGSLNWASSLYAKRIGNCPQSAQAAGGKPGTRSQVHLGPDAISLGAQGRGTAPRGASAQRPPRRGK